MVAVLETGLLAAMVWNNSPAPHPNMAPLTEAALNACLGTVLKFQQDFSQQFRSQRDVDFFVVMDPETILLTARVLVKVRLAPHLKLGPALAAALSAALPGAVLPLRA